MTTFMTDDQKINQIDPCESQMPTGLSFIRGVYWLLVSIAFFVLLAKVLEFEGAKKITGAEILLGTMVDLAVLLGFYWRKSWIVPLVLINASWKLIWQFLHVVGGSAIAVNMLTQKFTHLMFAIFCIYQIFVFTRRETRAYFRWKGQTII